MRLGPNETRDSAVFRVVSLVQTTLAVALLSFSIGAALGAGLRLGPRLSTTTGPVGGGFARPDGAVHHERSPFKLQRVHVRAPAVVEDALEPEPGAISRGAESELMVGLPGC